MARVPPMDQLSECVRLVELYLQSGDPAERLDLGKQIGAAIPEAKRACTEIGEEADVAKVFSELSAGLAAVDDGDPIARRMRLIGPLGKIAAWRVHRDGLIRLRAWSTYAGDAVTAFVGFASDVLRLADHASCWFPGRDPGNADHYLDRDGHPVAVWCTCPKESALLAKEIIPPIIKDIRQTLIARAMAEVRGRGEASFALPKLERTQRALTQLGADLCSGAGRCISRTSTWLELADAVNEAMLLTASPASGKRECEPAKTAAEACTRLHKEWATIAELSTVMCCSESAIRSRISRSRQKKGAEGRGPILAADIHVIRDTRPGMPRVEYRIRGVWHILSSNVRKIPTRPSSAEKAANPGIRANVCKHV